MPERKPHVKLSERTQGVAQVDVLPDPGIPGRVVHYTGDHRLYHDDGANLKRVMRDGDATQIAGSRETVFLQDAKGRIRTGIVEYYPLYVQQAYLTPVLLDTSAETIRDFTSWDAYVVKNPIFLADAIFSEPLLLNGQPIGRVTLEVSTISGSTTVSDVLIQLYEWETAKLFSEKRWRDFPSVGASETRVFVLEEPMSYISSEEFTAGNTLRYRISLDVINTFDLGAGSVSIRHRRGYSDTKIEIPLI